MSEDNYAAFISYSHADSSIATRLHKALERFRVPSEFRSALPPGMTRARPVFKDDQEMGGEVDLTETLQSSLRRSNALVVLCSPASARSQWVRKEIEYYAANMIGMPIMGVVDFNDLRDDAASADRALEAMLTRIREVGQVIQYRERKNVSSPGVLSMIVAGSAGKSSGALAAARIRRLIGVGAVAAFPFALAFGLLVLPAAWQEKQLESNPFTRSLDAVQDLCSWSIVMGPEAHNAMVRAGDDRQLRSALGPIRTSASRIARTCMERGEVSRDDRGIAAWIEPVAPLYSRDAQDFAELECGGDRGHGDVSPASRLSSATWNDTSNPDFSRLDRYFEACEASLADPGVSEWTRDRIISDIAGLGPRDTRDSLETSGAIAIAGVLSRIVRGEAVALEDAKLLEKELARYLFSLRADRAWQEGRIEESLANAEMTERLRLDDDTYLSAVRCRLRADYLAELDVAKTACREALAVNRGWYSLSANGFLALRLKQYDQARAYFSEAMNLFPDSDEVLYGLTIANEGRGAPDSSSWTMEMRDRAPDLQGYESDEPAPPARFYALPPGGYGG